MDKKVFIGFMKKRKDRDAMTLIEVMISLAVFSVVILGSSNLWMSAESSWKINHTQMENVFQMNWAMDFMSRAFSHGSPASFWIDLGGNRCGVSVDLNADNNPDTSEWFWRGDGAALGANTILYYGRGNTSAIANNNRKVLMENIIINPSGNPLFQNLTPNVGVELSRRPNAAQVVGRFNKDFTIRSRIHLRN